MKMKNLAVIRPAKFSDLEVIIAFAEKAGIGITSLPKNPKVLEAKLQSVDYTFSHVLVSPKHETYLFCLEWEGKVIGMCGIISRIGMSEPFFAYHLLKEKKISTYLNIEKEVSVLHFIQAQKKPTEIGTLFLLPEYRGNSFGKLLSFSRFLFIANFRFRFASVVIAELRGVNVEGHTPFWDAVGRHFFQVEFAEADYLRTAYPHAIEELFPKHPLYLDLLPEEAKKVFGKCHPETLSALKILEKLGFKKSHYYDIFDSGPHLYAPTDHIHVVRESKIAIIKALNTELKDPVMALVANTNLDFRACQSECVFNEEGEATLHPVVAEVLQVGIGEPIRYYPLL